MAAAPAIDIGDKVVGRLQLPVDRRHVVTGVAGYRRLERTHVGDPEAGVLVVHGIHDDQALAAQERAFQPPVVVLHMGEGVPARPPLEVGPATRAVPSPAFDGILPQAGEGFLQIAHQVFDT